MKSKRIVFRVCFGVAIKIQFKKVIVVMLLHPLRGVVVLGPAIFVTENDFLF